MTFIQKVNFFMHKSLIITLLALLVGACSTRSSESRETIRPVKVTIVSNQSYQEKFFAGLSTPDDAVTLAFKISGQIVTVPVSKGLLVKRGELIASLDPKEVELQVDANRSTFEQAQSKMQRMERLLSHEAISEQEWEASKSEYAQAKSTYENSLKLLSDTKLRAPYDGVIESTMVDAYQRVSAGEPIARLVKPLTTTVSFTIPESSLKILTEPETRFWVDFDNYPTIRFDATLKNFARTSTNASGFPTSLRLDSLQTKLYPIAPGMSCTIKIEYRSTGSDSMVVPLSAIYAPASGGEWVWVVDSDNRVWKREVTTRSIEPSGNISIIGGVEVGDKVVSAGVYRLREGQKVRII